MHFNISKNNFGVQFLFNLLTGTLPVGIPNKHFIFLNILIALTKGDETF